jgi:hypothetical protein
MTTWTGEELNKIGNAEELRIAILRRDGIASYRIMENCINQIKANGTDAEIEIFDNLPHGFGLGEGAIAEGWIDHAGKFWENHRVMRSIITTVTQMISPYWQN